MFTGIVQSQVQVLSAKIQNKLLTLVVEVEPYLLDGLIKGASVANNGVCLTAVEFGLCHENKVLLAQLLNQPNTINYRKNMGFIVFDVIDETLRVTNLAKVKVGDFVNIERSLKIGDEIGGHLVSGHVHCQASTVNIVTTPTNCAITFACNEAVIKYILPKGFITVNGVSLTVGDVINQQFTVHLIPETLARTNLSKLALNDTVNIELDQQTITIVDTIERLKLA